MLGPQRKEGRKQETKRNVMMIYCSSLSVLPFTMTEAAVGKNQPAADALRAVP